MEKDVAGDRVHTRSTVGCSSCRHNGRFWRQIMPHEFRIEADCRAHIYAAADDEVSTRIGDITYASLGEADSTTDVKCVVGGLFLRPCGHSQANNSNEQLHNKIFLHDRSHLPFVLIRNTRAERSYK